jgi:hypothetical protein
MNAHKNARLTFVRRLEMVKSIADRGLTPSEAAAEAGPARSVAALQQPTRVRTRCHGIDPDPLATDGVDGRQVALSAADAFAISMGT